MKINVKKVIESFENNTEMMEDVTNFAKYIAIKDCSDEKIPNLEKIIKYGDFTQFLFFCKDNIVGFDEKMTEYINNY